MREYRLTAGHRLLLLLSVALLLLSASVSAPARHHGEMGSGQDQYLSMLADWLSLNERQQAQVAQIHQAAMQQIRAIETPDWLSVITTEPFSETAALRLMESARQMQQQKHVIMLRAQHQMYHQVLDPGQQQLYQERMQRWRPGMWHKKHGQMRRYQVPES